METLTKTILAAGLAIASTSAFACADSQYTGNFTDGTKTISLYERERCGAIHTYREWAPGQKPTMRTGTPKLKLFSVDNPPDGDRLYFKRRNGEEYIISMPKGAYNYDTGYAKRINLDIKKDGRTLNHYTLKRMKD